MKKINIVIEPKFLLFRFTLFFYLTVSSVSTILELYIGIPKIVFYLVYVLVLVCNIAKYIHFIKPDIIVVSLILLFLFGIGIITNYNYMTLADIAAMLIIVLPSYYIFRLAYITKVDIVNIVEKSIILNVLIYIPLSMLTTDYMNYSYHLVINGCLAMSLYFINKKKLNVLIFIISTVIVVMYGSRGGSVCILVYILYLLIKSINKQNYKIIIGAILLFLLCYFNLDKILVYLERINSRTVITLLSNTFVQSSGRDAIYERCKWLIANNKLGYGPLSTRHLIIGQPYPHSLIYEIIIDYGIIFGTIIIAFIIICGVILCLSKNFLQRIGATYWILGFTMLMVSGSIYYNSYLYIAIAICVCEIGEKVSEYKKKQIFN